MKKSFTLSNETVSFLETVRESRNADSISSILEEILQAAKHQYERTKLERAMASYYSDLTSEAESELKLWGDFAMTQLPLGEGH